MEITQDNWHKVVDKVHKINPNVGVWQCLYHDMFYKMCINSVISPESIRAYDKYNALKGLSNENYLTYERIPIRELEQVKTIETEIARIEKIKQDDKQNKKK